MAKFSRRDFLSTGTAALAATATLNAADVRSPSKNSRYRRILIDPESPLPIQTAADKLAHATGASIKQWARTKNIGKGDIVLALNKDAGLFPEAMSRLGTVADDKEWELVMPLDGGLLIAGSSPRN